MRKVLSLLVDIVVFIALVYLTIWAFGGAEPEKLQWFFVPLGIVVVSVLMIIFLVPFILAVGEDMFGKHKF